MKKEGETNIPDKGTDTATDETSGGGGSGTGPGSGDDQPKSGGIVGRSDASSPSPNQQHQPDAASGKDNNKSASWNEETQGKQPRPSFVTAATDGDLLSPDAFGVAGSSVAGQQKSNDKSRSQSKKAYQAAADQDSKAQGNVAFVPISPPPTNKPSVANADAGQLQMLNKLRIFAEPRESNAAQQALRQISKAQSYRPPTTRYTEVGRTKNFDQKAAMRRQSRMSRLPTSAAGAERNAKRDASETSTTQDSTATTQTGSSGDRNGSAFSTETLDEDGMVDLEAIGSRHGAFSAGGQSSDDDDLLSTDSGPQFMDEDVDYSLIGSSTADNSHLATSPQAVRLSTDLYGEPDSAFNSDDHGSSTLVEAASQQSSSLQYETTITTAVLVDENDTSAVPDAERQRIQQETQQQMLENVHHAEVVDVDDEDKQLTRMERRKRIYLIVFCSIIVAGAIIVGSLAGTRCSRNPDAQGCSGGTDTASEGVNRLHDQCADAISVSPFDNFGDEGNIFTTTGATPDLELGICGNSTTEKIDNQAVWFELEGTGVPIEMTIRSTVLFPTWLAAFGGNCDELQCLDDIIDCEADVDCPLIIPTLEGERYFFLVGGANPFSFFVKIRETAANDVCATALALTAIETTDMTIEGSNTGATLDRGLLSCDKARNTAALGPSVWYSVVGTGAPLHTSLCGQGDDENEGSPSAMISVYDGNCTALQCTESVSYVPCGNHNHATWSTVPGHIYFVVLSGNIAEVSREFSFSIRASQQPNDICTMATPIELQNDAITVEISNLHATNDGVIANCIESSGIISPYNLEYGSWPGSFFEIEGTGGLIRISFPCIASSARIGLSVYSGSCGDLQCVFGSHMQVCSSEDDDPPENARNELAWVSEPQERYIVHATTSSAKESFEVFVQDVAENDICVMAISLDDALLNDQVVWGSTLEATIPDEFAGFCSGAPAATSGGVWYTVTGTGSILHVDTCQTPDIGNITSATGSSETPLLADFKMFNTHISVFSGDCGNLECQGGNDQSCGDQSSFEWFASEGQQYFILIHGFQVERGDFGLTIYETNVPFSDECEQVVDLIDIGSSTFSTTIAAEIDQTDACGGFAGQGPGVWFKLIGDGRRLTATTCDVQTNFNSRVTVFQGEDCDSLQCFTAAYSNCDYAFSRLETFRHGVVQFDTVQNQTYYVLVHGSDGESGFFDLRVGEAIANDV